MHSHQGIKVGFLTRYDRMRASSRVRVYDYLAHLGQMGFNCRVLPFPKKLTIIEKARYMTQSFYLAYWADVIVLQKLVIQEKFVDMLRKVNPKIIFDFDDALWTLPNAYRQDPMVEARQVQRLRHILTHTVRVIAGNQYLANYANGIARRVDVIPSSVDLQRYPMKPMRNEGSVSLGWIGSAENLVDLNVIAPVLRRITERIRNVSIRIVSLYPPQMDCVAFQFVRWEIDRDIAYLHSFDIGLMPLSDTERCRGRCGFKAVQYMAVGLPVVASNVGAAKEVVVHGKTGFLATCQTEWEAFLERLIQDKTLRINMGKAGRQRVEQQFSIQANVGKLATILREVAAL